MAAWPMAWRQMTFARAAGAEKQGILPLGDEGTRGQVEDQTAIDLRVEIEIEIVQRLLRVAEGGLLAPPLQQALAASGEFIGDQTRDQIDGGHGFGLSLAQARFQHGGHASES